MVNSTLDQRLEGDSMAKGSQEEKTKEEKTKMSIHKKGGEFDNNLTIYEIERALHPRAKEQITRELTTLMDGFLNDHYDADSGNIKHADKAVDVFLGKLAEYHFGDVYDTVKGDSKQVAQILRDKYGVTRESLRKAFNRKGIYKSREDFYASHRDHIVNKVDDDKKREAQESLNTYLNTAETRDEIPDHLEARTGKKLSDSYKKLLDLETTATMISHYMSIPGAIEKIEKNPKSSLDMPDTMAGHPQLAHAFAEGDKYRASYGEEPKIIDSAHRFKGKKSPEKKDYHKDAA